MKSLGCPKHPSHQLIGICASCLRERLLALQAEEDEAEEAAGSTSKSSFSTCDRYPCPPKTTLRSLFDKDDAECSKAEIGPAQHKHLGLDMAVTQKLASAKHVVASNYRFPATRDGCKSSNSWLISFFRRRMRVGGSKQRSAEKRNGEDSVGARASWDNAARPSFWEQVRASLWSWEGGRPSWDFTRPSWDGPNTVHSSLNASSLPPVSEGREISDIQASKAVLRTRNAWCNGNVAKSAVSRCSVGETDMKEKEIRVDLASGNHGLCVSQRDEVSDIQASKAVMRSRDAWCNRDAAKIVISRCSVGEADMKEKEIRVNLASVNHGVCVSQRDACTQTTPVEEEKMEEEEEINNNKYNVNDRSSNSLPRTWSKTLRSPIWGFRQTHRRQESNPSWLSKQEYSNAEQDMRRWRKNLGGHWLRFYLTPLRSGIASCT